MGQGLHQTDMFPPRGHRQKWERDGAFTMLRGAHNEVAMTQSALYVNKSENCEVRG